MDELDLDVDPDLVAFLEEFDGMQDATAVQTRPAMPTSVPNTAILANRSDTRKFKVFAPSLKRKSWSQRQRRKCCAYAKS